MSTLIRYKYTHEQTESTTGYFSCLPDPLPSPAEILELVAVRPLDSFLRRHALLVFLGMAAEDLEKAWHPPANLDDEGRGALSALLAEIALAAPALARSAKNLQQKLGFKGGGVSPLLYLRRAALADAPLHAAWAEIFNVNIQGHRKLPGPAELLEQGLPPLFAADVLERFAAPPEATLPELAALAGSRGGPPEGLLSAPESLLSAEEVAELALSRLKKAGALAGEEQRHMASLSPVGLLMPWRLDIAVSDARNEYTLVGQANTYGRGLSLAQARASCRMEMVERFSAYVSIADGEIKDRAAPMPILRATYGEILHSGEAAVDPNRFYIEAPYADEPLVWVRGLEAYRAASDAEADYRPVWVPLQLAALFCNCDEVDLAGAPGSTGIATGSMVEQARLAALTEIIERDSEATALYHKKRCFQLDHASVEDDVLAALLHDYRALGINLQFMDMTGPLGVPCYQAFVIGPKGSIHRGHAASLSGPRALASAITETPYPYPEGGPSGPMLRNLTMRAVSDLPNYSSGSIKNDLALLEALLCANRQNPVYVDFTHAALEFPVVRALIPGMQLAADFDDFTRLSPRLYKDYLDLFG